VQCPVTAAFRDRDTSGPRVPRHVFKHRPGHAQVRDVTAAIPWLRAQKNDIGLDDDPGAGTNTFYEPARVFDRLPHHVAHARGIERVLGRCRTGQAPVRGGHQADARLGRCDAGLCKGKRSGRLGGSEQKLSSVHHGCHNAKQEACHRQ